MSYTGLWVVFGLGIIATLLAAVILAYDVMNLIYK